MLKKTLLLFELFNLFELLRLFKLLKLFKLLEAAFLDLAMMYTPF